VNGEFKAMTNLNAGADIIIPGTQKVKVEGVEGNCFFKTMSALGLAIYPTQAQVVT